MSTRKENIYKEDDSLYTSASASVINLDSSKDGSLITQDGSVGRLDNASFDNTFLAGGDTNMNPMQPYKTPMRGGASDSKNFISHEMVTSTPAHPATRPARNPPVTPIDDKPTTPATPNSNSKRKRADSPDSNSGKEDEAFDETEYSQDELTEETTRKPLPSDSVLSFNKSPDKTDDTDQTTFKPANKTEKKDGETTESKATTEVGVFDAYTGINLPLTVTLLTTPEGARVYVVGTAHFSRESQEDVAQMIQLVKPQIVCVELCKTRTNILSLDEKTILEEAKNINFEKIRMSIHQMGVVNGLMYILLLNMSAHLTKELGMAPGGEFRRAIQEVKQLENNCVIHLSDRPLNVTIQRALRSLTWWQTFKLSWHLIMNKEPISKEEVERCKQRDLLEEMLKEMAGEFPQLGTVFVQERDVFLTHSLQLAATSTVLEKDDPNEPTRVVAVVGIGHVPGITLNWGKVTNADIPPLMYIPPPSKSSVLLKLAAKASLLGLAVWLVAKYAPRPDVSRFVRMR